MCLDFLEKPKEATSLGEKSPLLKQVTSLQRLIGQKVAPSLSPYTFWAKDLPCGEKQEQENPDVTDPE